MTQEEKAQRYDEAIEKLRSLHDEYDNVSTLIDIKEELENIFPELRESNDERIRKDIVAAVETYGDFTQGRKEEIYAWLKKQGKTTTNNDNLLTVERAKEMSPFMR